MTLNLRNRSLVPAVLEPLDYRERNEQRRRLEALPAHRETLPLRNERDEPFARAICFRGVKKGMLIGLRFFAHALAHVGPGGLGVRSLTFEGTVREFAAQIDKASGGGSDWHQRHLGAVADAIGNLDLLRVYLIDKDAETGKDRLRRLPMVAEVDAPIDIEDGDRIRIEFNPALLRLLQFDTRRARALVTLNDLHKLRSPRAATMLCQLSAHRHMAKRKHGGFAFTVPLDRVRRLYALEATKGRGKRATAYARWSDAWVKLQQAAAEVQAQTNWKFDMRTIRAGRRVAAVQWVIRRDDADLRGRRSRDKVRADPE